MERGFGGKKGRVFDHYFLKRRWERENKDQITYYFLCLVLLRRISYFIFQIPYFNVHLGKSKLIYHSSNSPDFT